VDCRLLKYEWITMDTGQDAELKAERYRGEKKKTKNG
jgi:hypothetical protein